MFPSARMTSKTVSIDLRLGLDVGTIQQPANLGSETIATKVMRNRNDSMSENNGLVQSF